MACGESQPVIQKNQVNEERTFNLGGSGRRDWYKERKGEILDRCYLNEPVFT